MHTGTVITLIDFLSDSPSEVDLFLWSFFSGFFCPTGSAFPQLCEVGFYCNQTGLHGPAGHCAAGYYCPQGSLNPHATPCPAGHYCPLGTLFPLPCPLGTMKSEIWLLHLQIHIQDIWRSGISLAYKFTVPLLLCEWINVKGAIGHMLLNSNTANRDSFFSNSFRFPPTLWHELVSFFEIQQWKFERVELNPWSVRIISDTWRFICIIVFLSCGRNQALY